MKKLINIAKLLAFITAIALLNGCSDDDSQDKQYPKLTEREIAFIPSIQKSLAIGRRHQETIGFTRLALNKQADTVYMLESTTIAYINPYCNSMGFCPGGNDGQSYPEAKMSLESTNFDKFVLSVAAYSQDVSSAAQLPCNYLRYKVIIDEYNTKCITYPEFRRVDTTLNDKTYQNAFVFIRQDGKDTPATHLVVGPIQGLVFIKLENGTAFYKIHN